MGGRCRVLTSFLQQQQTFQIYLNEIPRAQNQICSLPVKCRKKPKNNKNGLAARTDEWNVNSWTI